MARLPQSQRDEFGLFPLQRRFADAVLAGQKPCRAYLEVYGCKVTTAKVNAYRLLQKPVIAEYIEGRRDQVAAVALAKLQVDADWIRKNAVEVVERCMQAVPVVDKEGRPTGQFTFDAAGAIRALKLLSENCPDWGTGKPTGTLPVFVVLTR